MNAYGIPLDCREDYTKMDWLFWTTVMTDDKEYTNKVIDSVYRFINETTDRVPVTDWYYSSIPRIAIIPKQNCFGRNICKHYLIESYPAVDNPPRYPDNFSEKIILIRVKLFFVRLCAKEKKNEIIKAVIFDLDRRVLVTTDELHFAASKHLAEEAWNIRALRRRTTLVGRGVSRMASLEVVLEKTDRKFSDEEKLTLAEKKNDMYVKSLESLDKSAVLDGVFDFIAYLRSSGIKTAVGSASKNTPLIFRGTGFSAERTTDAVSCGLRHAKIKARPGGVSR